VAADSCARPALSGQVKRGVIPESRIDESVRRILELKEWLGLYDPTSLLTGFPELEVRAHDA
jgi:beta-glucosidase-like glycosyl hydrolase